MSQPAQVLIISQDLAIQNVAEQVCRVGGYRSVSADTLSDAEAILSQQRQNPFALMVIDLRDLAD